MRTLRANYRTVAIVLLLLAGFALVLSAICRGSADEAVAATADTGPDITAPISPYLLASKWTPADGATGVAIDANVTVYFNKDIKTSTLTGNFTLKKLGAAANLAATVSYNSTTNTATLNPTSLLLPGTTYEATLTSGIKNETGTLSLHNPSTWSFTTDTAPELVVQVPAPGATGVAVDQVISATFNRAMKSATITSSSFTVQKMGEPVLAATVGYDSASKTATLTPSAALETGATYVVTLTSAVKSEANLSLSGAPVVWSFTTADAVTTTTSTSTTTTTEATTTTTTTEETTTTTTEATTTTTLPSGPTFSDVAGSPYEDAIYELADWGAVAGYPDGTFRPDEMVKRQQFAKMIVLTLGLTVTGSEICPFTDVETQVGTDPFYPSKYVAVCAAANITKGKTATTFAPYDNITHQQLITMVVRAAGLADVPVGYVAPFTAGQFSLDEHYQNALKAGAAGLLDGLVGIGPTYSFLAGSTRGECAQILSNLLTLIGS